eukprot:CAMPEP_0176271084 /NCGR_PEP_ID=MMETSP0121_2-20121125/45025_1 /TAXON_ID=160619 /ORGANISM="Kryptoperidinium foliaceum, Strain CCMP 1326" /LENGTH=257 /DNA_ID=CAMNT_0017611233 /DNA_START=25 /DNA_END=794 /DNA_ORIENTATION=-
MHLQRAAVGAPPLMASRHRPLLGHNSEYTSWRTFKPLPPLSDQSLVSGRFHASSVVVQAATASLSAETTTLCKSSAPLSTCVVSPDVKFQTAMTRPVYMSKRSSNGTGGDPAKALHLQHLPPAGVDVPNGRMPIAATGDDLVAAIRERDAVDPTLMAAEELPVHLSIRAAPQPSVLRVRRDQPAAVGRHLHEPGGGVSVVYPMQREAGGHVPDDGAAVSEERDARHDPAATGEHPDVAMAVVAVSVLVEALQDLARG